MSLHGVVFRHISKIEERYGKDAFLVDEDGQACPRTDPVYPLDWEPDYETAVSEQIGNIAWLARYRALVSMHLPDGLISGILNNEVRRTDISEFAALQRETEQLEIVPELKALVEDLRRLIQAGTQETNPIVWV